MFEGKKYMTIGVKEKIGLDIQMIIWSMIDDLSKRENFQLDYLQIFDLEITQKDGLSFQQITHKQEVEPYMNRKVFHVKKPVKEKIFVISSTDEERKEYSTMLLAHEY